MTVAELQAHVDQRSTNLTKEKWKVKVRRRSKGGIWFDGTSRAVLVSEQWLAKPDLLQFDFDFAVNRIIKEFHPSRLVKWFLGDSLRFVLPIAVAGALLEYFRVLPPIAGTVFIKLFILLEFGCMVLYLIRLKSFVRSEEFLRQLLETTKDVERIRNLLAIQGSTPERFAKFDALVREMGLGSRGYARG
ncbi:MAG: hypothetical protein U0S12_08375 [Fimbriimonadales bacterium]